MKKRFNTFILCTCIAWTLITACVSADTIIDAKILYTSKNMADRTNEILKQYAAANPEFVRTFGIGTSLLGKDMLAIQIGNGKKEILINASHHGREMMTTVLVLKQIEDLISRYHSVTDVQNLLDEVSIIFVPMVNPDGVDISKGDAQPTVKVSTPVKKEVNKHIGWKANANGVDLNRNYPFRWEYIKEDPGKPSYSHYKGISPFSEPETKAIENLVRSHEFELVVAYHSAGEIIYWYAFQDENTYKRDLEIAANISKITGYKLDMSKDISGGMKDWFVSEFKKPGFTLEIGQVKYAGNRYDVLPFSEYNRAWERNKEIPIFLAKLVSKQLNPRKDDFYDIADNKALVEKVKLYGISGKQDRYGNRIFEPASPADVLYLNELVKKIIGNDHVQLTIKDGVINESSLYDSFIDIFIRLGVENISRDKLVALIETQKMDLSTVSRLELFKMIEQIKKLIDDPSSISFTPASLNDLDPSEENHVTKDL